MRAMLGGLVAAMLAVASGTAEAETLTIGIRVPITSIDPQLSGLSSDIGYNLNIYDNLFVPNATTLSPEPHLATGFKNVDERTWEIELRQGVKFHNGADFDAEDVVFSFKRLGTVPGSDNLIANYGGPIKKVEAAGPHTVRMTTDVPTPDLIRRLIFIPILCKCIDPKSTTEDFNNGKAAIGAGPLKLVSWKRGNELVLERFDQFWGEKSDFDRVVLREMPNDAGRVAALQAGDVDVIDFVPPLDVARLKQASNLAVYTVPSERVVFMPFDMLHDSHPLLTDLDGQPLPKNPLKDVRVRRALRAAISQDLVVGRVMDNVAVKATQGVPQGIFGYDPAIPPVKYDTAEAKKLLAEAGFPSGFGLTLSCPNDRWFNDAAICQAIGQMWSQAGVKTKVEAMPKSVYFKKLLDREFPVYLAAWGNNNGESVSFLTDVFGTRSKEKGRGSWNSTYSEPEFDDMLDKAVSTIDAGGFEKGLQRLMAKVTVDDVAYVPLHAQLVILAAKAGIAAQPRADEATFAAGIRKKN